VSLVAENYPCVVPMICIHDLIHSPLFVCFRCIQEPIRKVIGNNGKYVQAKGLNLDPVDQSLVCESTHNKEKFKLKYDKLVIAVGVKTNTFGIDRLVI